MSLSRQERLIPAGVKSWLGVWKLIQRCDFLLPNTTVPCIQALCAGITEQINHAWGQTQSSSTPIICTNLESTLGSGGISFAYAPVTVFMTCRDLVYVFRMDGVQLKSIWHFFRQEKPSPLAGFILFNVCLITESVATEKYLSCLSWSLFFS